MFAPTSAEVARAPSGIRLFSPSRALKSIADPKDLRLRDAADQFYFPVATHLDRDTVSSIRTTIANWERLTNDPPIGRITDEVLASFRDRFREDVSGGYSGRSRATVARNLRQLKTIFRVLGPRTDGNPNGKGLIDLVPHCRGYKVGERDWKFVSLEDLNAVYKACEVATWPSSGPVHPCFLWRAKFAWLHYYGTNPCDMYAALWCHISHGDGSKARPAKDRMYLTFTREKTAEEKPEKLHLPVPEILWRILRSLRSSDPRIFTCSATNFRDRNAQRDAIFEAAGIPNERRWTFADMRPSCSTRLNDLFPGLGAAVLGHAPRGVNSRFYDLWAGRMAEWLDRFPVPPAFEGNARQLRLFS